MRTNQYQYRKETNQVNESARHLSLDRKKSLNIARRAAALLIAGYACLTLYRRKTGKNNKITEQAE